MKIAQNFTVNRLIVALYVVNFQLQKHYVAHGINETSFYNILNNCLNRNN